MNNRRKLLFNTSNIKYLLWIFGNIIGFLLADQFYLKKIQALFVNQPYIIYLLFFVANSIIIGGLFSLCQYISQRLINKELISRSWFLRTWVSIFLIKIINSFLINVIGYYIYFPIIFRYITDFGFINHPLVGIIFYSPQITIKHILIYVLFTFAHGSITGIILGFMQARVISNHDEGKKSCRIVFFTFLSCFIVNSYLLTYFYQDKTFGLIISSIIVGIAYGFATIVQIRKM